MLRAPLLAAPDGFTTYSARSEFNTESGAITGDALAVGGTWTFATGGDTGDYTESSDTATRAEVSDTAARIIYPGSMGNLTTCIGSLDLKASVFASANQGLVLRYTGTDMAQLLGCDHSAQHGADESAAGDFQDGRKLSTTLAAESVTLTANTFYTLRVSVTANGVAVAALSPQGSRPFVSLVVSDAVLATGGALASGKVGMFDQQSAATPVTRTYDNFAAWVPQDDAVIFDGQSAQLTTQGHLREDAGGTAYGPVSVPDGALPRFPVPAQAGGTVETLIIPTNGDFDQIPDTMGTASISARATRRASWLFVPND